MHSIPATSPDIFKYMCVALDIKKTRTARYRPQSDGLVERTNRTIKKVLNTLASEYKKEWCYHLPYVMMAIRSSVNETTQCTPNLLMFGDENRLPVDILYAGSVVEEYRPCCPSAYVEWLRSTLETHFAKARVRSKKSLGTQKRVYDQNTIMRKMHTGQWVWVFYPPEHKHKMGRGWQGPYLIIDKMGQVNYKVQERPGSRQITVHVDHLREYKHDDTPQSWL